MSPATLRSTYHRYKEDTDSVVAWLASNAKAFGYGGGGGGKSLWGEPSASSVPSSTRLKGKARTGARKAGTDRGEDKKIGGKYIVAVKDFVPLADFIAEKAATIGGQGSSSGDKNDDKNDNKEDNKKGNENAFAVPRELWTTLARVIALRTKFAGDLRQNDITTDPAADVKHSYFVGVLEAVRETLRPLVPSQVLAEEGEANKATAAEATASAGPEADEPMKFSNRFAGLSVHEPSEVFLNAPDVQRPRPREGDPVTYQAETQTSLTDAVWAYRALVNDLAPIRRRINWIWARRKKGVFDPAAAAVTTEAAFDLAHGIISEVMPDFENVAGGMRKVIRTAYSAQLVAEGPLLSSKIYDTSNAMYFNSYNLLEKSHKVWDTDKVPLMYGTRPWTYNAASNRDVNTVLQKMKEDSVLLLQFLSEVMVVIQLLPGYPVQDEFMRGARELNRTRKIPFYLVFAAQIFLDIHHIMRDSAAGSCSAMLHQIQIMGSDIYRHLEFNESLETVTPLASKENVLLRGLLRDIAELMDDGVFTTKNEELVRAGAVACPETLRHLIHKHSPILSGLVLFKIRAALHTCGIAMANAWGSIAYSAELYHVLLMEGLVETQSWPDMDVALAVLGEGSIWIGGDYGCPVSPKESIRRFFTHMGVSAALFANKGKRRANIATQSKGGQRAIKGGVPVSSKFFPVEPESNATTTGATWAPGRTEWTPEQVGDVLARGEWQLRAGEDDEADEFFRTRICDPKVLRDKRMARERRAKDMAAGKKVDAPAPDDLIRALMFALDSESHELAVSYLSLHRSAWQLLQSVQTECNTTIQRLYGPPGYLTRVSNLPLVVGYILGVAKGGLESGKIKPNMGLMRQAASALQKYVGEDDQGKMSIRLLEKLGFSVQFQVWTAAGRPQMALQTGLEVNKRKS